MTKNGSSALKRAVRARMAETGENYTTALRRIQEQRQQADAKQE
ncbi:hypothetical protein ABZX65_26700 [Streptomyces sp. NPDC003300]